MNKSKGNMYPWITHTYNPIKGKCPHQCSYCYMKRFKLGEPRLDVKALREDLGRGNTIFVGSSIDMFAEGVPSRWIDSVIVHCQVYDNTYLFQSKNPIRFFSIRLPTNSILGTTIETNRDYKVSSAPPTAARAYAMAALKGFKKMVSIEPIMDFDLDILVGWIKSIKPEFVSIGADSKGHNLPEPSWEKVEELIDRLKPFTEVKVKSNLNRLKKSLQESGKG